MKNRLPSTTNFHRLMAAGVSRRRASSAPPPSRLGVNPAPVNVVPQRELHTARSSTSRGAQHGPQSPKTPPGAITVYTDGSCHGNYASGVGIYFGENHPLNTSQPLHGSYHSSGLAEIKAAQMALEQLQRWPGYKGEHVVIRTDYKPLIDILISRRPAAYATEIAEVRRLAESFPLGVSFQHIYGHNGHPAQEKADELARISTMNHRRARSASPLPDNTGVRGSQSDASRSRSQNRSRSGSRSRNRSRSRQRSVSREGRKGAGVEVYVPHRNPNQPLNTATHLKTETSTPTLPSPHGRPAKGISSESSVEMDQWPFQSHAEERPSRSREVVHRRPVPPSVYLRTNRPANPSTTTSGSDFSERNMMTLRTETSDIRTGTDVSTAFSQNSHQSTSPRRNVHYIGPNPRDHGFLSDTGSFAQSRSRSLSSASRNVSSPPTPRDARRRRTVSGDAGFERRQRGRANRRDRRMERVRQMIQTARQRNNSSRSQSLPGDQRNLSGDHVGQISSSHGVQQGQANQMGSSHGGHPGPAGQMGSNHGGHPGQAGQMSQHQPCQVASDQNQQGDQASQRGPANAGQMNPGSASQRSQAQAGQLQVGPIAAVQVQHHPSQTNQLNPYLLGLSRQNQPSQVLLKQARQRSQSQTSSGQEGQSRRPSSGLLRPGSQGSGQPSPYQRSQASSSQSASSNRSQSSQLSSSQASQESQSGTLSSGLTSHGTLSSQSSRRPSSGLLRPGSQDQDRQPSPYLRSGQRSRSLSTGIWTSGQSGQVSPYQASQGSQLSSSQTSQSSQLSSSQASQRNSSQASQLSSSQARRRSQRSRSMHTAIEQVQDGQLGSRQARQRSQSQGRHMSQNGQPTSGQVGQRRGRRRNRSRASVNMAAAQRNLARRPRQGGQMSSSQVRQRSQSQGGQMSQNGQPRLGQARQRSQSSQMSSSQARQRSQTGQTYSSQAKQRSQSSQRNSSQSRPSSQSRSIQGHSSHSGASQGGHSQGGNSASQGGHGASQGGHGASRGGRR
ncbi:unnamed protein product [Bursaphelenchus okinawaensis]|uniref:RNase H type-1 domain-containing protein n=1 Tax=Bursaphelenchus okinawaensis TaxID=465554 RepID=A0A811K2J6_9BILA|nr:unnamed protein product [Bursaphelenchus okinawaensis]CAG9090581.1 unnamed protein product [Bursaphelenchus okinawaensis]